MQCGLCAVVAGLFRRAMCIAGSRRGSGESCYQELASEGDGRQAGSYLKTGSFVGAPQDKEVLERRTAEITIDGAEQNAVFVRISEGAALASAGTSPSFAVPASYGDSATSVASRRLSDADRLLLEDLDIGRCRPRPTARFLTMHKRRRKRLATRSLCQEPGILDDMFHGQAQCILQNAGNWQFNAFTLETVTGGRSLPVLCVHLFHWYGLLQHFHLDVVRVWKLFALIEEGYHSTNPYHNSIHATDVTQAMHCFLQEDNIKPYLSPLEIMASLIAAVTHDLDHPGVNQPFLVATSNHLAALYENTSVLENHHWRSAVGCLLESGVLEQLPPEMRPELERHISSLILATDITRQQEFLTRFKQYLDEKLLEMRRAEDRHFILQIALKCADISNPCRPWDISRKWSHKVCEEFFRQGDYERQLNLPVTPLCDRRTTSVPKIQAGFFKFVVAPLYEEWHRFLGDGLSVSLMEHLRANQNRWEVLILRETVEETTPELLLALEQQVDNGVSSGDEGTIEDSASVDLLLPDAYVPGLPAVPGTERVGRRHSVPLSVIKSSSSSLMIPRTIIRRESLPMEHGRTRTPLYRLEDQHSFLHPSSLSLLSSRSSAHESSLTGSAVDRPVSAENLLPEPSIASITSSAEASRLSSVLQPDQKPPLTFHTKQLTRQQTFPPLQPYVRMRYMSTTSEMARCCTEVLMEADSSSSSASSSPVQDKSCSGGQCGTPPSESPARKIDVEDSDCTSYRPPKRRASAVSDIAGRSVVDSILPVPIEHPRRHSVQTVDSFTTCSGLKHAHGCRHRRPYSVQEPDTAQKFYASLTGARVRRESSGIDADQLLFAGDRSESPGNEVIKPSSRNSIREYEMDHLETNSSLRIVVDATSTRCGENLSTSRRYSTPVGSDLRSTTDSVSRRFSAIPVPAELGTQKVFFVGTPPDSPPPGVPSASSSDNGSSGEPRRSIGTGSSSDSVFVAGKRDSECTREKDFKIPKLSVEPEMKENVDPRVGEDGDKVISSLSRRCSQGWARRRGSAPVGLLSRLEDVSVTSVAPRVDRYSRRGSVPTDITRHQNGGSNRSALGPRGENLSSSRRASLPQETALESLSSNVPTLTGEQENCPSNNNNNNNNNHHNSNNNNNNNNNGSVRRMTEGTLPISGMPSPRRGSVPADMSELRRELFNRNSLNGKSRNRKKILRRRSSGGPEMFAGGMDGNDNGAWLRWKRDLAKREDSIPEPVVKRRGSLPIEMVAISHTGSVSGPRRSSLWRL